MGEMNSLDESRVRILAELADLPLADERPSVIRPPLSIWLADANELNRKMSAAKFWEIMPATVFKHLGG